MGRVHVRKPRHDEKPSRLSSSALRNSAAEMVLPANVRTIETFERTKRLHCVVDAFGSPGAIERVITLLACPRKISSQQWVSCQDRIYEQPWRPDRPFRCYGYWPGSMGPSQDLKVPSQSRQIFLRIDARPSTVQCQIFSHFHLAGRVSDDRRSTIYERPAPDGLLSKHPPQRSRRSLHAAGRRRHYRLDQSLHPRHFMKRLRHPKVSGRAVVGKRSKNWVVTGMVLPTVVAAGLPLDFSIKDPDPNILDLTHAAARGSGDFAGQV